MTGNKGIHVSCQGIKTDGGCLPIAAIIHFFYKAFGRCCVLWGTDPIVIVELHIRRIIIPACAADAKEHLQRAAILDRLLAGTLKHRGKVKAESAAA